MCEAIHVLHFGRQRSRIGCPNTRRWPRDLLFRLLFAVVYFQMRTWLGVFHL